MSVTSLLKDPQKLQESLADFLSSKDRIEDGLAALSYSDGVITAAIVGPEHVPFSEWLPLAWAPSDASVGEEDSWLAEAAMRLQHDKIIKSLGLRAGGYEPFFWENDDGRVITRDWAVGFLTGIRLRRDAWERLLEGQSQWLLPILSILLQNEKSDAKMVELGLDPETVFDEAIVEVPGLIAALYSMRREEPAGLAPFGRPEKETGRNDPCPCGSGRKYKNCCLN
jgi:uncharacterized protein